MRGGAAVVPHAVARIPFPFALNAPAGNTYDIRSVSAVPVLLTGVVFTDPGITPAGRYVIPVPNPPYSALKNVDNIVVRSAIRSTHRRPTTTPPQTTR